MKKHTKKPTNKSANGIYAAFLNAEMQNRDKHRRNYSDMEWLAKQRRGAPKGRIGDIVKFRAGGWGVIDNVSCGDIPSYSVRPIEGRNYHPRAKYAWHYEGDFLIEMLGPVHKMEKAGK